MNQLNMSDDAIGGDGSDDQLDRQVFAQRLAVTINAVRRQSESSVLAIIGSWGSGKTSVLNMVMTELRSGPWAIAEFNPWLYPSQTELQDGFFAELRSAMEGEAWGESRRFIGALGKTLSPLGKLTTLAALPDASEVINKAAEKIAGDQSATRTKRRAEDALRQAERPILVVLDDLDRLTPDELLLTLKLVRLVGNLPNVYYLLSYDETTLLDVLRSTPLVGDSAQHRAGEYLEKIVQVRLDLPSFRQHQKDALVNSRFEALLDQLGVAEKVDVTRISSAYRSHLSDRLTTPRSINRFFSQVAATFPVDSADEIDFVDFFLTTWIRTSEPRLYSQLTARKAELTGGSVRTPFMALSTAIGGGQRPTREERIESWRDTLAIAGVSRDNVGGVLEILAQLFVPIRALLRNSTEGGTAYRDVAQRRGVGHADYFDRYFAYGVPTEDVPDSLITAALQESVHSTASDFGGQTLKLLELAKIDSGLIIRKIQVHYIDDPAPVNLLWLFSELFVHTNHRGSVGDPAERLVDLSAESLAKGTEAAVLGLIETMLGSEGAVYLLFVGRALQQVHAAIQRQDEILPAWFAIAVDKFSTHAREMYSVPHFDDPTVFTADDALLVWIWGDLSPDSRGDWLRNQVSSGRWGVIELLAALQQGSGIYGSNGLIPTVGDVRLSTFEDYLGLDFTLDNARDDLERFEPVYIDSHHTNPSFSTRRDAVASALKRELVRRASE